MDWAQGRRYYMPQQQASGIGGAGQTLAKGLSWYYDHITSPALTVAQVIPGLSQYAIVAKPFADMYGRAIKRVSEGESFIPGAGEAFHVAKATYGNRQYLS